MKIEKLIYFLEKIFPLKDGCKWDNNGRQINSIKTQIDRVLVCLDATLQAVEYAIENGIKFIINHHPLFFEKDLEQEYHDDIKRKIIKKLRLHNITVYALHTNYDASEAGMNKAILKDLNCYFTYPFDKENIAQFGVLEQSIPLQQLIEIVKLRFSCPYVQYYGNLDRTVYNLAVCAGSGGSVIEQLPLQCDLFITGELKWHQWLHLYQKKQNVIVLNHYMENTYFTKQVSDLIKEKFNDQISVYSLDIKNPIKYI